LVSVAFSAFFSGMEMAFVSSNKLRLKLDVQKAGLSGSILSIFYNNPQQFIATMLVGNNIALVVYGMQMAELLEPQIMLYVQAPIAVMSVQTFLSTLIILFTAEFLPKSVFRINPNISLALFALPLFISYILLAPVAMFTSRFSKSILHLFKLNTVIDTENRVFNRIDLNNFLEESIAPENANQNEVKIFQNALDFSKIRLRDCIVPRTDIVAIQNSASIEELRQLFIETGYSKILVYGESIDNIIGYIHSSELFKNPRNLKDHTLSTPIVPETMPANKLMQIFMRDKRSLAVVVDEFGGTAGIVTMEDIFEEIFGEIEDEHDTNEYVEKKISDTEFVFSARLEIKHLNEKFHLQLPDSDEFDTLAGLILYFHENLPKINEEIVVGNFIFKVLKASANRIELVKLMVQD